MTARQGAPDRPVETHADMPFCAEVREAAPVVLALRSVLGRVPVNANSLCSAIGRRYQSLRSSVIALCSGKAHPETVLVAKGTFARNELRGDH